MPCLRCIIDIIQQFNQETIIQSSNPQKIPNSHLIPSIHPLAHPNSLPFPPFPPLSTTQKNKKKCKKISQPQYYNNNPKNLSLPPCPLSPQMQQRDSIILSNQPVRNKFVNLLFINSELRQTTFKKTIIFYVIMAIVFIALSITLFVVMNTVREEFVQYYNPLAKSTCDVGIVCNVTINVQQYMTAPIYFMYEIGNFYQNHRRYIQSKSNFQLAGNLITTPSGSQVCWPFITNEEMGVSKSWGGVALNGSAVASPCGAIAKTFFNDTFKLFLNGNQIAINENGISWPGDQGYKYKRASDSNLTQWIDPQNEHFIVWMRTSGLPDFKKLWGRIQTDLSPGQYTVQVNNNYNSTAWEGARYVHLTTKTVFGGKNIVMPISFMILGVGCIVASLFFFKKWQANKNHVQ